MIIIIIIVVTAIISIIIVTIVITIAQLAYSIVEMLASSIVLTNDCHN